MTWKGRGGWIGSKKGNSPAQQALHPTQAADLAPQFIRWTPLPPRAKLAG
jgi:hypothetical protein